MRTDDFLLCTDLDRTLLPNGEAQESPRAREYFAQLVSHPNILLAYVSGRDQRLVHQAIEEYDLPYPDYLIADVGSTIYQCKNTQFHSIEKWQETISQDWKGYRAQELEAHIGKLYALQLQAKEKQGPFKLSYQVQPATKMQGDINSIHSRLRVLNIRYNCIASVDETINEGLVDILPASANKKMAIDFLVQQLDIHPGQLMFSGDSGNDIDVLSSEYQAVLVANATDEVRQQAIERAKQYNTPLYLAQARAQPCLNGNYAGGIIDGFLHYFPQFITQFH